MKSLELSGEDAFHLANLSFRVVDFYLQTPALSPLLVAASFK
jgi:hypothetical protein